MTMASSRRSLFCAVLVACTGSATVARAEKASPPVTLTKAYRRELQLVRAEQKAMRKVLAALQTESAARSENLQREIRKLTARLTKARAEADRVQQLLRHEIKGKRREARDDRALEATLVEAERVLPRGSLSGGNAAGPGDRQSAIAGRIERVFAAAARHVVAQGRVRRERGRFFDARGQEHRGPIVRVGRVAAFSDTPELRGVLLFAGEGLLRLARRETTDLRVKRYLRGERVAAVPVFVSGTHAREVAGRSGERGLWGALRRGGVIVWPIAALALLALAIALWRTAALWRLKHGTQRVASAVVEPASRGLWSEAERRCTVARRQPIAAALGGVLSTRQLDRPAREAALDEALLAALPLVRRALPVLAVIAAVAPLLGLLGTVTGMITTFDVITEHGTGDPRLLSGGISEALITTELGLIVAIPVLLLHAFLAGWAARIGDAMESAALQLSRLIDQGAAASEPSLEATTSAAEAEPPGRRRVRSAGPERGAAGGRGEPPSEAREANAGQVDDPGGSETPEPAASTG